jgi:cytoskeleton protein RodZ
MYYGTPQPNSLQREQLHLMKSIGEMLRNAREAQGRSLADLASEMCIMQRYLRAIEENDVASLPGTFFFLSFARQYAALLGLDETETRTALTILTTPVEPPVEAPKPEPIPAFRLPRIELPRFQLSPIAPRADAPVRLLDPIVEDTNRRYFAGPTGLSWVSLLAAVLVGSGIFAWWTRPPQTVHVMPAVPFQVAQVRSASPVAVQNEILPDEISPGAIPPDEISRDGPVESTGPPADNDNVFQAAANIHGGNEMTLNLSATERTWLSITSHGKVIFSGILEPSQSKVLKGSEVATMKIGNAGGVDVQWNGKSIGPIGARGQVRTVRFTREDFKIIEPVAPDQL